jgi:outer membrane lipoprotein-sorting protein
MRIDLTYRLDPKCGWIPIAWTDAIAGAGGSLSRRDTVTDFTINQPISDAEFKIEIPKGAQVNDRRKRKS